LQNLLYWMTVNTFYCRFFVFNISTHGASTTDSCPWLPRILIRPRHLLLVAENAEKPDVMSLDVVLDTCVQSCLQLSSLVPNIFVSLGRHGVVLARRGDVDATFPTKQFPSVTNNNNSRPVTTVETIVGL